MKNTENEYGPPKWFFWLCGSIAALLALAVLMGVGVLVVLLWRLAL